ncbi:hypothetical protein D049_2117B, partial [Vibrio parahaemolyticus VPTS-2010]
QRDVCIRWFCGRGTYCAIERRLSGRPYPQIW